MGAAALLTSAAAPGLDFTLGFGPADNCRGGRAGLRAAALAYLEPAPVLQIKDYGGRHYHPGDGENVGIGTGYADITVPVGKACAGVFYRTDYRGDASPDTLDALVANRDRRPFDVGRRYALAFDSAYVDAMGLKLSRVLGFEAWRGSVVQFGLTGSIMKALTHREETLRGSAVATSGDYAVGTARLERDISNYNMRDFNPFVRKADPEGYGYAVDASMAVRSAQGYAVELTVMDAYAHLDWQDVPSSLETIDNQDIRYDANFNREAFVQGRDRRLDLGHRIEPRYRGVFLAPLDRGLTLVVSDDYVRQTHFPALGLRYAAEEFDAALGYDVQTHAVSLDLQKGWLTVSITSNDLNVQDASVLGARLGVGTRF